MSDSKSCYSEASKYYVEVETQSSEIDAKRYERSKERERRYNENWIKRSVNINDIVDCFTPGCEGYRDGVKLVFENERYLIKADMPAGYLRIYDKTTKQYLMPNGAMCTGFDDSHFKIKKREEM